MNKSRTPSKRIQIQVLRKRNRKKVKIVVEKKRPVQRINKVRIKMIVINRVAVRMMDLMIKYLKEKILIDSQ